MALKLYVWEDALEDHTSGAIFAIAHTVAEARKIAIAQHGGTQVRRDVQVRPRIINLDTAKPEAWLIWGGG
jgi:hypothetical protein